MNIETSLFDLLLLMLQYFPPLILRSFLRKRGYKAAC